MRLAAVVLLAGMLSAQPPRRPEDEFKNPLNGKPEAIEAGRSMFSGNCGVCHGPNGEGGRGPNLITGRQVSRGTDRQLFTSIQKGLPGTEMPPSPLPEEKIWQLVAFVRALSSPAYDTPVPGDVEAGRAVFFGKGECLKCHSLRGQGGQLAPDLSNIGATRPFPRLHEALIAPNARLADGFQGVTVVLTNGRRVVGVLKDRTNYGVEMIDGNGELHRIGMDTVREVILSKDSPMPADYKERLTPTEVRDLLAFLSRQSIRGGSR